MGRKNRNRKGVKDYFEATGHALAVGRFDVTVRIVSTMDASSTPTFVADKTFAEIKEAYTSGAIVSVLMTEPGVFSTVYHLASFNPESFCFNTTSAMNDGNVFILTLYINEDDSIRYCEVKIAGTVLG